MMEFIEYSLNLNTGEVIEVSEISNSTLHDLDSKEVQEICKPVLEKCTYVSRFSLEEAKLGFSKQLDKKLGISPLGALIKVSLVCSEINNCVISDLVKCNTNYHHRMGKKIIYCPPCWNFEIKGNYSSQSITSSKILVNNIISAWKLDHYVIIVDETDY